MSSVYYYIDTKNDHQIKQTESMEELVELLFEGLAETISDAQRKDLKLGPTYLLDLRKLISKYELRVPLYDITSNHLFLINHDKVYPNIFGRNYRFADQDFLDKISKLKNPTSDDKEIMRILSNYDIKQLQKTYIKIFYKSFVQSHCITNCRRPSFHSGMDHIMPYYTREELYYLAYDWEHIDKVDLTETELEMLCKKISKFDIPSKILLDHQMYIYASRSIGLGKHYSLYGSYYMNRYLRLYRCFDGTIIDRSKDIRNVNLENQIGLMINLITKAPAFTKSHTVYRFVETDEYLSHLKIGDIYTDPSFMSTTRNPFYYQENYAFGYILIKINLPEKIPGIGLCIESYSNFPTEEEIILLPTSRYKLIKVTDGALDKFHHILNKKVNRKYEFTWVGNDHIDGVPLQIRMNGGFEPTLKIVDMKEIFRELMSDSSYQYLSVAEKIRRFGDQYVNNFNNQFESKIGDVMYTFNIESYNSTNVYKQFFWYEVPDGIMLTSSNKKFGNINIMLELGPEIHVNYYFKYSVTDSGKTLNLSLDTWIEWLSLVAHIMGSRYVIIHSNYFIHYSNTDSVEQKQNKTRYTYSDDIYQYFKNQKKRFGDSLYISPNFDYAQLNYLSKNTTDDILDVHDKDEVYRVAKLSGITNLMEFYIHIAENNPKLLNTLIDKFSKIYSSEVNPFENISYKFDTFSYLYDKKYINHVPTETEFNNKKGSFKKLIGEKKINQFKNRLRMYLVD
mgnify:FL=1